MSKLKLPIMKTNVLKVWGNIRRSVIAERLQRADPEVIPTTLVAFCPLGMVFTRELAFRFKGNFSVFFSRKGGGETEIIPSKLCVSNEKVNLCLLHTSGQKIILNFKAIN